MLADRIKELRESQGLSQTALAKKLGITRSSVNAWEMGISVPTTQYVIQLAKIFRISTDYILDVEPQKILVLDGLNYEQNCILQSLVKYFNDEKEIPNE